MIGRDDPGAVPMTIAAAAVIFSCERYQLDNAIRLGKVQTIPNTSPALLSRDALSQLARLLRPEDLELRNRIARLLTWKYGAPGVAACPTCSAKVNLGDIPRTVPLFFAQRQGMRQCPKCRHRFTVHYEDLIVPLTNPETGETL